MVYPSFALQTLPSPPAPPLIGRGARIQNGRLGAPPRVGEGVGGEGRRPPIGRKLGRTQKGTPTYYASVPIVRSVYSLPALALPRSGSVGRWRIVPPSQPGAPSSRCGRSVFGCLSVSVNLCTGVASCSQWRQDSGAIDRKSTRLNSSHVEISYAVFCLKK